MDQDTEIREEIYQQHLKGNLLHNQIDQILHDPAHPYHHTGDYRHTRELRKMQILHELKHGTDPFYNEVMPVISKTAEEPNAVQGGSRQIARVETGEDDIFNFLDR